MKNTIKLIAAFLVYMPTIVSACTIFCGKDKEGQVWAGNNEDNIFSFNNYINVFPKTAHTKYGFYTLSYHTPQNGENTLVQGGMNEAGLFYDMNTLDASGREYIIKDLNIKKPFPKGDDAILSHIFANFSTVEEVVEFFNEYWFEIGFKGAQIHVADRFGHFAMIDPTGSRIVTDEDYQVSTNFSICGNEDSYECWRFPIAQSLLAEKKPSLELFKEIAEKTAQRGFISTIYSNIQNLNTGDIWFYFALDYEHPYQTNIQTLLSQGRKSYLLRDLFKENPISQTFDIYLNEGGIAAFDTFQKLKLPPNSQNSYLAAFVNNQIANDFNLEALPFLEEYLKSDPIGHWMTGVTAIAYFNQGNKKRAIEIIHKYKEKFPETSMDVAAVLNRFEGIFPEESNLKIELTGHSDAKNVFVKGLPGGVYNFLIKKDGKWIGEFKLDTGIYNYSFAVDGKNVLDEKTPVTIINSAFQDPLVTHQICIGMSAEMYQTTIKVQVPNKDDVVYIAGNQNNLTNWNSVLRLKKTNDFEREISLLLHYPAKFKFTQGNWDTEAIIEGTKKGAEGGYYPQEINLESSNNKYVIVDWKDKMK